jgi:predicted dehydrogenase
MKEVTRRDFTRAAGMATALSYSRVLGANDRLRMGFVGLGNRGDQVHDAFLEFGDSQTVAICDLREDYMDLAAKKSRGTPKRYNDYRKLLEDKDVDAVAIATPDHWHALMFIDACNAGKDVYVEKPFSLTVAEGRKMVETAERTKRIVQVGLQRRSTKSLREAAEFVQSGGIGQVTVAKGFHLQNEWPNGIGAWADTAPPSEEQWDRWLGPAPKVPYNKNRTFYNFRWFYNYSGGQVTNFGVHYVDTLRWCLGVDSPKAVTAMGGRYAVKDNREVPDTAEVLWEYPGPVMMVFTQYNANNAAANPGGFEMELRGTKGTMYLDLNGWEVVPQRVTELNVPARTPVDRNTERGYSPSKKTTIEPKTVKGRVDNQAHVRNFLDCVKARNFRTNCDAITGHLSTTGPLIGNIALRTKSYLEWDAKAEKFTNNAAANKWLQYQYRAPYKFPA